MSKRTLGFILVALGAIGAVISLAADVIGLGTYPGINGAQLLGMAIGIIVAAVGVWLVQSKADQKK